jgi:hypothetical protein
MKVIDCFQIGRTGNAMFRYLAGTLLCIVFKCERASLTAIRRQFAIVDDQLFARTIQQIENGSRIDLPDLPLLLIGFYQHNRIYDQYRPQILAYIKTHPNDVLESDNDQFCWSSDLITDYGEIRRYDTVLHLRLEDFIGNGNAIHPESIAKVVRSIRSDAPICVVVKKPATQLEHKYISYLERCAPLVIESNDVLTDYHIMRHARVLICSLSTLSWMAGLMSETITTVYFPNYPIIADQTFKVTNSRHEMIYYDYQTCNHATLDAFLARN